MTASLDAEIYHDAFRRSGAVVVVSVDAPFHVLDINPKALRLLSLSSSDAARGKPLFEAVPQLDLPAVRHNLGLSSNPQRIHVTLPPAGDDQPQHLVIEYAPSSNRSELVIRIKAARSGEQQHTELGKKRTREDTDEEHETNGTATAAPANDTAPPTSSVASAQTVFSKIAAGIQVQPAELSAILPALVVEGCEDNVRFALQHGADPNHAPDAVRPFSALYAAVQLGKVNLVKLLLQHHASLVTPNFGQPGETPLKLALKTSPSPIFELVMFRLSSIDAARQRALAEAEELRRGSGGARANEPESPYQPPSSKRPVA